MIDWILEQLREGIVFWVFPALMVYAAMTDLIDRRIANWISLALVAGFAVLALVTLMPPLQIAAHLGIAVLAFGIGFVLFALGTMGGGDVKLIAASILWFGPEAALAYAIAFSLAGLAVTLVFVALRLDRLQYLMATNPITRPFAGRDPSGRDVPYGMAISAGALLAVPMLATVHGVL